MPHDAQGRWILGALSVGFLWVFPPLWWEITFEDKQGRTLWQAILHAAFSEFFLMLILASLAGVIWAVAAPVWLEALGRMLGRKLLWALWAWLVMLGLFAIAIFVQLI